MNDLFQKLRAGLQGTSAGTRIVAVLVGLGLLAVLGAAGVLVNRPHYAIAFSGLDDHEVAQVNKALSDAGIAFEVSQPPGPFVVFVDDAARTRAYMAVYGAGALDKPLEGILSDGGVASVFNSAEERAQGVRKREWQEMEKMLEELDFVVAASVRSAPPSGSPLLGARSLPLTASVTLRVAGGRELAPAQAATVANLVSRGLGVARRDLTISDQNGTSLYDGETAAEKSLGVEDLLAQQAEHDRKLSEQANALLSDILGPGKARVSVSSEWDNAQSTQQKETAAKGAVVQETKTTSEKPVGGASGSMDAVAGLSSNTLDPDSPLTGATGATGDAEAPAPEPLFEKTSEEKKDYAPSTVREQRVRLLPELARLSVALFLDQSIPAAQKADLESAIKAAVGFVEERDAFSSVTLSFAPAPAPAETVAPGAAPAEPSAPNPLLELLLRHGVEIAAAAVFLVLLLKSLKGARRGAAAAAATDQALDPELLARAQVHELLESDPARVGEILSRWAREEPVKAR